MKKLLSLVLALFVMIIFPLSALASENNEDDDFNSDSFTAFSNLQVAWANQGYEMYPDYVGGVYFENDGRLIVALSDDTDANRAEIKKTSGMPEVITFTTVKYSYKELQDIVDEITYNCDNNKYNFLVNFANIVEEENIVEIRVGSSEIETAKSFFTPLYGDKIEIYGGYDIVSNTDYEEIDDSDTRTEKINSTKKLRLYISIGVIAVLIIAVLALSYLSQNKKQPASSPRRYRK